MIYIEKSIVLSHIPFGVGVLLAPAVKSCQNASLVLPVWYGNCVCAYTRSHYTAVKSVYTYLYIAQQHCQVDQHVVAHSFFQHYKTRICYIATVSVL